MVDGKKDITAVVKKLISDHLGVNIDQVSLESKFLDDLGADSLDIVELVMSIEEEFEVNIPDNVAEKLLSVKDVIDFVKNY